VTKAPHKIFDIRIEELSEPYLEATARVHAVCFPDRIETFLGLDCIVAVYRDRFLGPRRDSQCLLAINQRDDRVAAFVYASEPGHGRGQTLALANRFISPRVLKRYLLARMWFRPRVWLYVLRRVFRKLKPGGWDEGATLPLPPDAVAAKMLGVAPEFRFGNVGIDLMVAIQNDAHRRGVVRMMGLVEQTNTKAERLYRFLGWVRTSPNSDHYAVFAMQKDLTTDSAPQDQPRSSTAPGPAN